MSNWISSYEDSWDNYIIYNKSKIIYNKTLALILKLRKNLLPHLILMLIKVNTKTLANLKKKVTIIIYILEQQKNRMILTSRIIIKRREKKINILSIR